MNNTHTDSHSSSVLLLLAPTLCCLNHSMALHLLSYFSPYEVLYRFCAGVFWRHDVTGRATSHADRSNSVMSQYYETQKDYGDGSQGNKEGTASLRRDLEEREKEPRDHKGWWTEAGRSIYSRTRNGNSSTNESDSQIKRKKLKYILSGDKMEMDKRPRLQKLQNMSKIKAIMQTANKAM